MSDFEFINVPEQTSSLDPVSYQYFNQLLNHRTIIFNGEVDESIVETVYVPLRNFENDESEDPITLIINSVGGSVIDGFFVANYLATFKKKLNIIVTGCAMSMALTILAGGGKNPNVTRKAYPHTSFLIHEGYTVVPPSETRSAVETTLFNQTCIDNIKNFIIENSNISEELFESKARKQWYFFAPEAKELGLIDEILE